MIKILHSNGVTDVYKDDDAELILGGLVSEGLYQCEHSWNEDMSENVFLIPYVNIHHLFAMKKKYADKTISIN
jgi:hypothetical protein